MRIGGTHTRPKSEVHFGMVVPVGGSNCAKCEYASQDGKRCRNKEFISFVGGTGHDVPIPAPADRYCCNGFESKPGLL